VRLDAVALDRSRLEELIEGAPAVAARVSLTSHCITVTDPADVTLPGRTAQPCGFRPAPGDGGSAVPRGRLAPFYNKMATRTPLEPQLTKMLAAFETSERVELALRRVRKRDAAIARLVEKVHAQRMQLAQDLRAFLYRGIGSAIRQDARAQAQPRGRATELSRTLRGRSFLTTR
jgi:hypothetical protein